jgi:phenylacetic acid degradation operon negative regulatory protein
MAMTLLADYGLRSRVWIPAGAIVALLGEFGVTPGNARAAVSRLTRRGMLERLRQGRRSSYRIAPDAAAALAVGGRAVAGFPDAAEAWDGWWTIVSFSLPTAGDAPRRALRNQLRWLGFAPLYDGLWVSPRSLPGPGVTLFRDLPPGAVTVFRAQQVDVGGEAGRDPLTAWSLAEIRLRYEAFLGHWSAPLARVLSGQVGGVEALHLRTEVMDTYRHFLSLDPQVPERLMPRGWPRREARGVFAAVYDGLLEPALAHVTETVARHTDGAVPVLRGHTVADLLAGLAPADGRDRTAALRT